MNLIDQILNWAGLLLWLNWQSVSVAQRQRPSGPTLLSTLKRAEPRPPVRWLSLAGLLALLGVRSFFYWHVGSQVNWTPALDLDAIAVPFRSDDPRLMVIYSLLSFGQLWAVFYAWLLLISAVNAPVGDAEPLQRLVRLHLGWLESWPAVGKVLLPPVVVAGLWGLLSPRLAPMGVMPAPSSLRHLGEQAVVLGVASVLWWKWLLVSVLSLHLLNSYVHLGRVQFLNFMSLTARNLLVPLESLPLRWGRVDGAPILALVLVLLVTELGARWLPWLYLRLPF